MSKESLYVVAYDISCNRRRYRVAKLLKDYGVRVNLSVLECRLDKKRLKTVREQLSELIDKREDSVVIYSLCSGCWRKGDYLGNSFPTVSLPPVLTV